MRLRSLVILGLLAAGSLTGVGELSAAPDADEPVKLAQNAESGSESSNDSGEKKDKAQKVLKLLKEAKKAAKAGNYSKAYNHFKEANDIYPRPGLQFRMGQLADRMGDKKKALGHFQKFLDVTPPEAEAEKETKKNIQHAKTRIDELKEAMPAVIEVDSTPEGADVYLGSAEGEPVGQTPLTHELEEGGDIQVIITKSGYEKTTRTMKMSLGETQSVDVELTKKTMAEGPDADAKMGPPSDTAPTTKPVKSGGAGAFPAIGWGAAGLGVAGIGTGVAFHILYQQTDNEVDTYVVENPGNSQAELDDLEQEASNQLNAALVGYSAGGAFFVSGATILAYHYLIRGGGSKEKSAVRPTFRFKKGGAVGGIELRF